MTHEKQPNTWSQPRPQEPREQELEPTAGSKAGRAGIIADGAAAAGKTKSLTFRTDGKGEGRESCSSQWKVRHRRLGCEVVATQAMRTWSFVGGTPALEMKGCIAHGPITPCGCAWSTLLPVNLDKQVLVTDEKNAARSSLIPWTSIQSGQCY